MWKRLDLSGSLFHVFQERDGGPLVAIGYSNQAGGEDPRSLLPDPGTIRARAASAGAVTGGSAAGPHTIFWGVNRPIRMRLGGGRARFLYRLADPPTRWDEDDAGLLDAEGTFHEESTREAREEAEERTAAIQTSGFEILEKGPVFVYRDAALRFADARRPDEPPYVPIEIPLESEGGTLVLRPWRLWAAADAYWRPGYDAWLSSEQRRLICERVGGWLFRAGRTASTVLTLPGPDHPIVLPRVSMPAMQTLLAFLLTLGQRLPATKPRNPNYPGSSDPMEVLRGPGSPRKWYQTQGGEENVHVEGPIPVDAVHAAFVLPPGGDAGTITVSREKIDASGGDLWAATIWATP